MKTLLAVLLLNSLSVFAHSPQPQLWEGAKSTVSVKLGNWTIGMWHMRSMDLDVLGVDYPNKVVDLYVTPAQANELSMRGFDPVPQVETFVELAVDDEYYNSQEIEEELFNITQEYPEISKKIEIGRSVEGRSIWAIKISDNAHMDEPEESAILFNSMHHAREVMTPEVSMDIARSLTSGYANDERVRAWVDQHEIWIVPMLNVDGNNRVWNGQKMWRKNTRGGYGVDINRNYPTGWGSCRGSSSRRRSSTFRGPNPASEPETKALMKLVETIRPVFNISYHSYSQLVLYPYGCRGKYTENREVVHGIGKELGDLLDYRPGTPWEILYSADGGDIDWMYQEMGVIPYVLELNPRSAGFHPSYARWRNPTIEKNRKGWQHLLDRMNGPGVKGRVPASEVGDLKIFSSGNLVQTYKIRPDGSFHVVLKPGKYTLKFAQSGRTETVSVGKALALISDSSR